MVIPVFYKLETVSLQKLQDIHMGKITKKEADKLKAVMGRKRRRGLTVTAVCAVIFMTCALLGLFHEEFFQNDGVAVLLFAGVVIPFLVAIFQLLGLSVSLSYCGALKRCVPGSVSKWKKHPLYKLNKTDKKLLGDIAAGKFTPGEARGIQNIAEATRSGNICAAVIMAVLACAAVFLIYGANGLMAAFGESMAFFPPLMGGLFALVAVVRIFSVGVNMKYINAIKTYYSPEREDWLKTGVNAVISEIRERTSIPAVKLTAKRGETTVFSSKLGGTPYLPPGFAYPRGAEEGLPLRLLAQLNFEELPKLSGFPDTGILQFYTLDDEAYGVSFDDLTGQKDFRVIYHGEIVRDMSRLGVSPEMAYNESFPFEGEFALTGELETMPMTAADHRFDPFALSVYNSVFSANETNFYHLRDDVCETIVEAFDGAGHRVGGYPYFTQEDPRGEASGYTVTLLQIDTDDEIMWGDSGVANFFISPEKLRARDFSDVMYTWDCC